MWILPKQLHTLASAQATEALSLDLNESSQLCAQSLFVRSKPSPLRTWLQKWKRDSWTQHLFGRILRPSLGKAFEIEFTSSLEVIPVSPLVQQASEPAKTTLGICGLGLQMELLSCDQDSVSSKTSKDTSALDSGKSLQIWKALVTQRRGEYSQRLNAVRLTSASVCLSWPTAAARDYKGTSPGYLFRADGKSRVDQLPVAVDQAEAGNWPTPTVQEAGKIGNQANHGQLALSNHPALRGEVTREKFEKGKHGPAAPDNHSTHGSRPESWATPRTKDAEGWMMNQARLLAGKPEDTLTGQVTQSKQHHGKLNPRWVETLMGLPVGWTMPSCASPVTIAPTSCASSVTESSQPQQH